MSRRQKKYHGIYKTTNIINGKFYVGMHSTDDLNDGYMGSGRYLKRAIKKYGVENFKIEYLEFLPDKDKLREREKEIVTLDFIKDPLCMNLQVGGLGAPNSNFGSKRSDETKKKMSAWVRTPAMKKNMSKAQKNLYKRGIKKRSEKFIYSRKEKRHSDETKLKMSIKRKGVSKTKETRDKMSKFCNSKPRKVIVYAVVYNSIIDCARSFNMSKNTIRARLVSQSISWKDWNFFKE